MCVSFLIHVSQSTFNNVEISHGPVDKVSGQLCPDKLLIDGAGMSKCTPPSIPSLTHPIAFGAKFLDLGSQSPSYSTTYRHPLQSLILYLAKNKPRNNSSSFNFTRIFPVHFP